MPYTTHLVRPLVLASASPRRADLLRQLGLPFSVSPAHTEEPPPQPGQDIRQWAGDAARRKAMAPAEGITFPALVLGADTVVLRPDETRTSAPMWDGRPVDVMGKPADAADARRMLRALSGRSHFVVTALAVIALPERTLDIDVVVTTVAFRHLDDEDIAWYLSTGEPFDKAGAYGIQGLGAVFVSAVHGDYYTVVGLPLARLWQMLSPWRAAAQGE